jgi:4-hydroxybenzoate polyprenyltransferase
VLVLQGSPLLGFAFSLPTLTWATALQALVLGVASFLLVAHVFAFNDWAGLVSDALDPNKAAAISLARGVSRGELGVLSLVLLGASLVTFTLLPSRTLLMAVAIAALSTVYSHPAINAKGIPLLCSVTHLAGGILHFLLGYSVVAPVDRRGSLVALFFALTFTAGHLNQEVRDHDGDRAVGHRTNAVAFGPTATFLAGLGLFTLAYADLLVLAWTGLVPALAGWLLPVVYPLHVCWSIGTLRQGLTFDTVSAFQQRYRVLYALIGLTLLASIALG